MKKRLFLLMLTLVSMCPTIYGADHEEVPFEPNITLPLAGERIELHERLDRGYANRLGAATMLAVAIPITFIAHRYVTSLVERAMPRSLSTNSRLLVKWIIRGAVSAAVVCPALYLRHYITNLSTDRMIGYRFHHLNAAVEAHNTAVGNEYNDYGKITGMITQDGNGNRVLRRRRHNLGYEEYPYRFDQWRENREEATREVTSGLINKLLLGPGNLRRIRVINEKLNALDSQLRVPQNVKGARRS